MPESPAPQRACAIAAFLALPPVTCPAVSVVVPVYNPGPYLRPLLASLLAQTEPSLEIIAVDDGSTDGSGEVLREVAAGDARLVVVTRANGGYAAARNSGLDAARGRWIGFADSDDWLDPRTLQTWREHGERHGLEVVYGNGFSFCGEAVEADAPTNAPTHEPIVNYPPPPGVFSGAAWIAEAVPNRAWMHFVWLQLIAREALVRCGLRFDESIVHEDVVWNIDLGLCMQRIGYVDTPLYGYRVHDASFTYNRTLDNLGKRAASYIVIMRRLLDEADARPGDPPLQRALRTHAQREGRRFHTLMKKGTLPDDMRRTLARDYLHHGLARAMFVGAEGVSTGWRAVRSWCRLQRSARF